MRRAAISGDGLLRAQGHRMGKQEPPCSPAQTRRRPAMRGISLFAAEGRRPELSCPIDWTPPYGGDHELRAGNSCWVRQLVHCHRNPIVWTPPYGGAHKMHGREHPQPSVRPEPVEGQLGTKCLWLGLPICPCIKRIADISATADFVSFARNRKSGFLHFFPTARLPCLEGFPHCLL